MADKIHPTHDVEVSDVFPGVEHCRRCGWYVRFYQGPNQPPKITRKGSAECVPATITLRRFEHG